MLLVPLGERAMSFEKIKKLEKYTKVIVRFSDRHTGLYDFKMTFVGGEPKLNAIRKKLSSLRRYKCDGLIFKAINIKTENEFIETSHRRWFDEKLGPLDDIYYCMTDDCKSDKMLFYMPVCGLNIGWCVFPLSQVKKGDCHD